MPPVTPDDICRMLGEPKTRALFLELPTDSMKKIAKEAGAPQKRSTATLSSRRRNEDWAQRIARAIGEGRAPQGIAAAILYEWLAKARREMLAAFLGGLEVKHDHGLTESDFMKELPPERLCAQGRALLASFDRREAAAYLLFLDVSNGTEVFAELALESILREGAAAAGDEAAG